MEPFRKFFALAQGLLRRQGYISTRHIGVTKEGKDQLLAQAWLEREGGIILGGRYSPLRFTPLQAVQENAL